MMSAPPPLFRLSHLEDAITGLGSQTRMQATTAPGIGTYEYTEEFVLSPSNETWSRPLASPDFVSPNESPFSFQQAAETTSGPSTSATPLPTPAKATREKTSSRPAKGSLLGNMLRRRKAEEPAVSIWDDPARLAQCQTHRATFESVEALLNSPSARDHITNTHGGRSPFAVVHDVNTRLKTFKDLWAQDSDSFARLANISSMKDFDMVETARITVVAVYVLSVLTLLCCTLWAVSFQGWMRVLMPALWLVSEVYAWQHGNASIWARALNLYTVDIHDEYQFPVSGIRLGALELLEAMFVLLTLGWGAVMSLLFVLFSEHKQTVTMMLLRCVVVGEVEGPVELADKPPREDQEPPRTPLFGTTPNFMSRLPRAPGTAIKLRSY
jgi:hypothetical protein